VLQCSWGVPYARLADNQMGTEAASALLAALGPRAGPDADPDAQLAVEEYRAHAQAQAVKQVRCSVVRVPRTRTGAGRKASVLWCSQKEAQAVRGTPTALQHTPSRCVTLTTL
jgi:hypothetical protein